MNSNQQLIIDLHEIEVNTIKKEKNFDFRTPLISLFKALYKLFESKQDVSKKDLANAAEKESRRLGLEGRYEWNEIFDLEKKVTEKAEKQGSREQKLNKPDNFYVGRAIDDGNCFFDSFRQGLEQQTGVQVTVEQLRNDCREFAQNNPPEWFANAIVNSHDNNGQHRSEDLNTYVINIMSNNRWGDPEVEGRILCGKYGVRLHFIEDQSYFKFLQREVSQGRGEFGVEIQQAIIGSDSNEALTQKLQEINSDEAFQLLAGVLGFIELGQTHSLIDSSGNMTLDHLNYNDQSIIHMMNEGCSHFEPLLNILAQEQQDSLLAREVQGQEDLLYAKQLQDQEEKDFLLARQLQEQEDSIYAQSLNPRCSMEEVKIEDQQQQISVK
ncbi:hypothetical protein NOX90_03135 [Wolbachia endosymbiont of Anurida maritima]|uniref:hypothetical protein n=1 Tax=Wolbachia endosymbiont of Anurida maritima TaxID=2850562 RepID=UPI0035D1328B